MVGSHKMRLIGHSPGYKHALSSDCAANIRSRLRQICPDLAGLLPYGSDEGAKRFDEFGVVAAGCGLEEVGGGDEERGVAGGGVQDGEFGADAVGGLWCEEG